MRPRAGQIWLASKDRATDPGRLVRLTRNPYDYKGEPSCYGHFLDDPKTLGRIPFSYLVARVPMPEEES